MKTQKLYWGKTIASFFLVLFTMPLGHALMRVMEDTMSPHAVNVSAFIMGAVGLAIAIWGVFVKGDTKQTLFGLFGGKEGYLITALDVFVFEDDVLRHHYSNTESYIISTYLRAEDM